MGKSMKAMRVGKMAKNLRGKKAGDNVASASKGKKGAGDDLQLARRGVAVSFAKRKKADDNADTTSTTSDSKALVKLTKGTTLKRPAAASWKDPDLQLALVATKNQKRTHCDPAYAELPDDQDYPDGVPDPRTTTRNQRNTFNASIDNMTVFGQNAPRATAPLRTYTRDWKIPSV